MAVDRTGEFQAACTECSTAVGFQGRLPFWAAAASPLPALAERSPFSQAAQQLHENICQIRRFLRDNHRDYVGQGRCAFGCY